MNYQSIGDAVAAMTLEFTSAVEKGIKELLESKHLYQSVALRIPDLMASARSCVSPDSRAAFDAAAHQRMQSFIVDLQGTDVPLNTHTKLLFPRVANVKLYCRTCKGREAFAPVWAGDPGRATFGETLQKIAGKQRQEPIAIENIQFLLILYQCQVCKNTPEAFLIRLDRRTWSFSLHGRSPIESVETPRYIPKGQQHWYSNALVAHQSGKTLAGLFYLRTFLEQFARAETGLQDRMAGDDIMESYNRTLPADLSSRMPSLREWYDKLSDAVHTAREDAKLFDDAVEAINEHFDIRRAHKIQTPKQQ